MAVKRFSNVSAIFYREFATKSQRPTHIRGEVDFKLTPDAVDLSLKTQPLGQLFGNLPTKKSDWDKYRLSTSQLEDYRKNGYLANVKVFEEKQIKEFLKELDQITNPDKLHPSMGYFYEFHWNQSGDPNNVLLHALGHWRITPLFHDLIWHPAITVPTSQLMKINIEISRELASADPSAKTLVESLPIPDKEKDIAVRFWHDQLFAKPAHHGGGVAWHQDYSYWTRSKPMNHMTVHLALDEQTLLNGSLHFVPESHKWHRNGLPLPITSDDFSTMDSIQTILTAEEKEKWKPVPSLLKRGEVSFHHPLMVHGSYENRSSQPRRAAVVNYFADGTYSDTNEDLLKGVSATKGKKLEGQFFPLVFDPKWIRS